MTGPSDAEPRTAELETTEIETTEIETTESETGRASDVAERGRLDIHPSVFRKVVEHAADATPGTLRHERRVAGVGVGSTGSSATVTHGPDGVVDVRLELTLQYPAPVRRTVDAVRTRVGDDVARTTGRRVRNLAVTVSGLRGAGTPGGAASGARVQ